VGRELLWSKGRIYRAGRVCYEPVRSDKDSIGQVLGRVRREESKVMRACQYRFIKSKDISMVD
jgi:hypothetical protein